MLPFSYCIGIFVTTGFPVASVNTALDPVVPLVIVSSQWISNLVLVFLEKGAVGTVMVSVTPTLGDAESAALNFMMKRPGRTKLMLLADFILDL